MKILSFKLFLFLETVSRQFSIIDLKKNCNMQKSAAAMAPAVVAAPTALDRNRIRLRVNGALVFPLCSISKWSHFMLCSAVCLIFLITLRWSKKIPIYSTRSTKSGHKAGKHGKAGKVREFEKLSKSPGKFREI